MHTFGERLKDLRLENELSQVQLAKKVGLSKTAIGLWELGKRIPNFNAVITLARFFNVTTDFLAGLED